MINTIKEPIKSLILVNASVVVSKFYQELIDSITLIHSHVMIFSIILPNSVYFQHQEYIYPYIFCSYKMLNFKAYTGQKIGLSISIIYLHSNECELVIKIENFILVLP